MRTGGSRSTWAKATPFSNTRSVAEASGRRLTVGWRHYADLLARRAHQRLQVEIQAMKACDMVEHEIADAKVE